MEREKNSNYDGTKELEMVFGRKPKVARSPQPISRMISPKTTRHVEENKRSSNKKLMKTLGAHTRTTSLTDIRAEILSDPTEVDQQTAKRKRTEISPAGAQDEERCKATQLKTIMDKICFQAKTIEWIVNDTYKCKTALKTATARLLSQVQKYLGNNLDEWLEEMKSGVLESDAVKRLEHENQALKRRLQGRAT